MALGLNSRELADKVGVTATHIQFIESGKRQASPALLKRLADAFGVPVETLYTIRPDAA